MADYIPNSDALFSEFVNNFSTKLALYQALLGVTVGQVADYGTKITEWLARHAAYLTAKDTVAAALAAKKLARADLQAFTRDLAQFITNNLAMTDELREEFRLTVPDEQPTEVPSDYLSSIDAPSIHLEWGVNRGQCTIHFGLVPTNENLNGKPEHVMGAEIEFAMGGIPVDDSLWQPLALDTNSPYVHNVGDAAPQKYGYRARWVDTRGRKGPYGEAADVTISD